jgi:hypothetical protein
MITGTAGLKLGWRLGVLAQLLDPLETLPDGRFRSHRSSRAGELARADGEQKSNDQRWKARKVTVHAEVENPSPSGARFTVDWSSRVGSLRG